MTNPRGPRGRPRTSTIEICKLSDEHLRASELHEWGLVRRGAI